MQEAYGEHKGCFAPSSWFEISYELMNQENKLFSVQALCQVLFLLPTHTNNYSAFIALEQEQGLKI